MSEGLDRRLVEVFCGIFGDQYATELTPETSMDDVREWDSVTFTEFVIAVEDEFGVQFTADQSAQMFQLGNVQKILDEIGRG